MGLFSKSWSLGRAFGISVQLHATLLLLIAFTALRSLGSAGVEAFLLDLILAVGLFGSVLLHELGHALTARRYGVQTRRIMLTPLGGVAQLESMPRDAKAEFWIAIAGPLVSFALAAGAWALSASFSLFILLAYINLALGLFNLLPVFPSDGGRILRAWLGSRMGFARGTQLAVRIGQFCAMALGAYAIISAQWMLMLVAGFLYLGARQELRGLGLDKGSWSLLWSRFRAGRPDSSETVWSDGVEVLPRRPKP